uniref:Uncharacterized protein n=1 Tax=Rhipicephalus zambeziensis TaxID=60191 RepID=A0A224YLT9_9ACAR
MNMENLERKVALLQRFNNTAKDHSKALEGLTDTIVERLDELRQFDQSHFTDQLYRTVELSQDGPSDSGEHPSGEQGASCGDGTLPVLESFEDLVGYGRSLRAHSKSKPNLAAGHTEKTLLPNSTDLGTSDDLDETLKPSLVVGATEPSASQADSTEQDVSDELDQARKSDMAVGDVIETELDDTLNALEYAGDMFHRKSEELWRLLQKFKKDGVPENPVKQCLKYWMELVNTLQSCCVTREEKMRQQRRLSAEWTSEDYSFKKAMLSLKGSGPDQIERQMQSLRQRKRLEGKLKQDMKNLDELARELEDRNLEAIEEIQKKHDHDQTIAAEELQRLMSEVQDLDKSRLAWNKKARDSFMSSSAPSAERPPALACVLEKCENEILKAALDSFNSIESEMNGAGISEVAGKLSMAEAAADAAKHVVESDPISETSEALRLLDALLEQDELFVELKTKVAGRTFEEWLPELDGLITESLLFAGASKKTPRK